MVKTHQKDNPGITTDIMDKGITLSFKQIGAIALIALNVLLIGPGSFLLKTLWTEARDFKEETEDHLKQLDADIGMLKVDMSAGYVTRQSFSDYREQMAESIRYLDSKVSEVKD